MIQSKSRFYAFVNQFKILVTHYSNKTTKNHTIFWVGLYCIKWEKKLLIQIFIDFQKKKSCIIKDSNINSSY